MCARTSILIHSSTVFAMHTLCCPHYNSNLAAVIASCNLCGSGAVRYKYSEWYGLPMLPGIAGRPTRSGFIVLISIV
jgi:hypothetical protein